jgi:hypothetical protein
VQFSAGVGFPPIGYERMQVATGKNRAGTVRYNAYWRKTSDEDLAERVRRAWEMMLEGYSYKEIDRALLFGLGKNSYNDFFSTLTYTGTYSYGDFERRGAFEPYVSWEEWEQVQKIIKDRTIKPQTKPALHKYLLSGMVRCGDCGLALSGLKSSRPKRTDIYYYECGSRRLSGRRCKLGRIRADRLERLTLEGIGEFLEPVKIYELAGKLHSLQLEERARNERPIAEFRSQLASETSLISSLILKMETIGRDLGVEGDYIRLIGEARERRAKAQAELDKLLAAGDEGDLIEFELNHDSLMDAKVLLGQLSGQSGASPLLGSEVISPVRKLLSALGVKLMLYPDTEGLVKASAAISLDLGRLGSTSHLMGGAPGRVPCLGATFIISIS